MTGGGGISRAGPSAGSESMSGGAGSGEGEWQRIFDRVEAQVEVLAAGLARQEALNGIQYEFWNARDDINQAELSRSGWESACKELLPGDGPKLEELVASDLEDSRLCKALFEIENSELKIQLKEFGTCEGLSENSMDHEKTARGLRADLRKLNQAYESMCANKDKEYSTLLVIKEFVWNQLRKMEKESTALLQIKEVEATQATEAAQKLRQNIEEMQVMQVAAQHKDNDIGRSRAEAGNAKKRVLILHGKLLEMHSLVKEKNDEIQKLKNTQPERLKCKCASPVFNEIIQLCGNNRGEMNRDDYTETSRECSEDIDEMDLEECTGCGWCCGLDSDDIPNDRFYLD